MYDDAQLPLSRTCPPQTQQLAGRLKDEVELDAATAQALQQAAFRTFAANPQTRARRA